MEQSMGLWISIEMLIFFLSPSHSQIYLPIQAARNVFVAVFLRIYIHNGSDYPDKIKIGTTKALYFYSSGQKGHS